MSESAVIDAAVRRQVARARAEHRAGLISLAELARVTRWARETLGQRVTIILLSSLMQGNRLENHERTVTG